MSRTKRPLAVGGLIAVLVLAFTALGQTTAYAFDWLPKLCTGFSDCNAKNLGNAGYEAEYTQSHWGMDGGHNCTNYAAYRLIKNGIDASYLRGQGMAYQWGGVAASRGVAVDGNPRPGDIAWWSNTSGIGASGHVAYVESVDSATGRVTVSEDNAFGGDFDWRTYNIKDVTGFIHFGGAPSTQTDIPRIGMVASATAFVKEGALDAGWVNEYGPVADVILSGNRIGVLTTGGAFLVKEGSLSAPWVTEYTGVAQGVLSGNRIGVLTTAGAFLVKEGSLSAPWVTEYGSASRGALSTP